MSQKSHDRGVGWLVALAMSILFWAVTAAILFSGCADPAQAQMPYNEMQPEQYTRDPTIHWSRQFNFPTSSGTGGLLLAEPDDTTYAVADLKCFPWGTNLRVSCLDETGLWAWVLDNSITIATSGLVTDGATDTANNVKRVMEGTYISDTLSRSLFGKADVGRRTGFCTGTTNGAQNNWPCNADADCPGGACRGEAEGSCIESDVNYCDSGKKPVDMITCAFVTTLSMSGAAVANCFVEVGR